MAMNFMTEDNAEPPTTNVAYSYIRFSTVKQAAGASLGRQLDAARAWADQHNMVLDDHSYQDLGVSAYRGKNLKEGSLGAFLTAVDSGLVPAGSTLLVENIDRLSRAQVDEALELFLSIIRRGITVVTLQDGQVYSTAKIKEDRGISLIISITYMMRAHEESATKGSRVRDSWLRRRRAGKIITSISPSWLTLNNGQWEVDHEKSKTVQTIFSLSDQGLGTPTIARRLNEDQRGTFGSAPIWTNGLVSHVLKNSAVIGTYTPKKAKADSIEGYYPAIIDKSLYYSVQAKFKDRTWSVGNQGLNIANLFSGICFCEHCGSKIRLVSSSKPNVYLRCVKSYSNAGCDAPRIPYLALEKEILGMLLLDQDSDLLSLSKKTTDSTVGLKGDLAIKVLQRERLLDAIMDGTISKDVAQSRSAKLESEIKSIQTAISTAVPASTVSDAIQAAFGLYEAHEQATFSGEGLYDIRLKLQAALRRVLKRVTLGSNEVFALKIEGIDEPILGKFERLPQGFQQGNINGR